MKQITVQELKDKLSRQDDVFLLDVREDVEHEDFNIGGLHIPLGQIVSKASNIPTNKPVIVYCQKGVRSQIAIQRLEEKFGFNNLVNLQGGMKKWNL